MGCHWRVSAACDCSDGYSDSDSDSDSGAGDEKTSSPYWSTEKVGMLL